MNSNEGMQGPFALIAAAFVTGIWAWIAQRTKNKGEGEQAELNSERQELSIEVQDRQNLVQEYREANRILQDRISLLQDQIGKLWDKLTDMQKAVENCERMRLEDNITYMRRIMELENNVLKAKATRPEEDKENDG